MFGLQDDTQKSNDDPAMLDNVKDLASQPASTVEPPTPAPVTDSSQPAAPTTPGSPASNTTPQPVSGFNMPEDSTSPAPSPTTAAVTADDSGSDNSAPTNDAALPAVNDNPGHIEPAEGFSSTPVTDSTTDGGPAAESSKVSNEETAKPEVSSETPQISQHSTPSLMTASEPKQNDVTAPPEPVVTEVPAPVSETPAPTSVDMQHSSETNEETPSEMQSVNKEELAAIKQEALGHLEGLADHIEGNPEEVFRSTMQLIQANDNHTLLGKALEAAKKIEDDKVRAQAMLDIVNETNYFSQDSQEQ